MHELEQWFLCECGMLAERVNCRGHLELILQ